MRVGKMIVGKTAIRAASFVGYALLFSLCQSPASHAAEDWVPLKSTACDQSKTDVMPLKATLGGFMIDEIREYVYDTLVDFNCQSHEKEIVIEADQSTNRALVIENGRRYYAGRPFERSWVAPPETDVVIFVASQIDIGSPIATTRLVMDYILRSEPIPEIQGAVARHLLNNGDKCRHAASTSPIAYEILLVDVDLSLEEIGLCIKHLY